MERFKPFRFWRNVTLCALATGWLVVSCDQGVNHDPRPTDPPPSPTTSPPETFELMGYYANELGNNPMFIVFPDSSDPEISCDTIVTGMPPSSTNEVEMWLKHVSVSWDSTHNLFIDSVKVEERRWGSDWILDTEFSQSPVEPVSRIAVVLVLDASESLGNHFQEVKNYAKKFVEIVFQNAPEARVGIIFFATEIRTLDFSSDISLINSFIENAPQGHYTALYDGMLAGIQMLALVDSTVAEGKALLTFTDGINNYGTANLGSVKHFLDSLVTISSFTIGFEGSGGLIDKEVLEELAIRGQFQSATSLPGLQDIFIEFARAVSQKYHIRYRRNNQIIPIADPIHIRFTIMTH